MRAERLWRGALQRAQHAEAAGALVPLQTELVALAGLEPFVLRRLLSRTPKHLRPGGPRPNPFLPWDAELELERLGTTHVVLLNKFPVQPGHLLVISQQWQSQAGWLDPVDWQAVVQVSTDTGGFWFFNSCAEAGASQPHRHLQLLPRHAGQPSCPLAEAFQRHLRGDPLPWPWSFQLSRRSAPDDPDELDRLYRDHAEALGLGRPGLHPQPRHPYNLLFDDDWFLMLRRRQEHCAGYSVNALGFGGYLLATEHSDLAWLQDHGPLELLRRVATPLAAGGP
ncbi:MULTISPECIES: hypothetical protein [Aphanothece]|uniref:hypothetical protein n=1 Tax=Aphanothece TaxID=1121 RepID=UPI003984D21C